MSNLRKDIKNNNKKNFKKSPNSKLDDENEKVFGTSVFQTKSLNPINKDNPMHKSIFLEGNTKDNFEENVKKLLNNKINKTNIFSEPEHPDKRDDNDINNHLHNPYIKNEKNNYPRNPYIKNEKNNYPRNPYIKNEKPAPLPIINNINEVKINNNEKKFINKGIYYFGRDFNNEYEGDLKNGLAEGIGKVSFNNGDRYEGKFENGKFNGKGIYYFSDGDKYEGDFKNGIRDGKGKLFFKNGDIYEGEFKNNVENGTGTYFFKNGAKYIGKFEDGFRNGYGELYTEDKMRIYKGEFKDEDNKENKWNGICCFNNGDIYEGEFKLDTLEMDGKGKLFFKNGGNYIGDFKNDKFNNGKGVFYHNKTNEKYEGEFKNGKFDNGKGIFYYKNGDKYKGEIKNGVRYGKGIHYYTDGERYEGDFKNGVRDGEGTYFFEKGAKYTGEFKNGVRHGKGIYYFGNGDRYEGEFKNDVRDGKGIYYFGNGDKSECKYSKDILKEERMFCLSNDKKYEEYFQSKLFSYFRNKFKFEEANKKLKLIKQLLYLTSKKKDINIDNIENYSINVSLEKSDVLFENNQNKEIKGNLYKVNLRDKISGEIITHDSYITTKENEIYEPTSVFIGLVNKQKELNSNSNRYGRKIGFLLNKKGSVILQENNNKMGSWLACFSGIKGFSNHINNLYEHKVNNKNRPNKYEYTTGFVERMKNMNDSKTKSNTRQ